MWVWASEAVQRLKNPGAPPSRQLFFSMNAGETPALPGARFLEDSIVGQPLKPGLAWSLCLPGVASFSKQQFPRVIDIDGFIITHFDARGI
jgi:hypothetical protein